VRVTFKRMMIDQRLHLALNLVMTIRYCNCVAVGVLIVGDEYFGRSRDVRVVPELKVECAAAAIEVHAQRFAACA